MNRAALKALSCLKLLSSLASIAYGKQNNAKEEEGV
jgi:hypothetical protein